MIPARQIVDGINPLSGTATTNRGLESFVAFMTLQVEPGTLAPLSC